VKFYNSLPRKWFGRQHETESSDSEQPFDFSLESTEVRCFRLALLKIVEKGLRNTLEHFKDFVAYMIIPLHILFYHWFVFDTLGDAVDVPLAVICAICSLAAIAGMSVVKITHRGTKSISKMKTAIVSDTHENNQVMPFNEPDECSCFSWKYEYRPDLSSSYCCTKFNSFPNRSSVTSDSRCESAPRSA
jgi:hypothetical protein